MMYFTETGDCPEDPIALNDAFEAEYDTTAYENKISLLMAQAYRRIKRENPEKLRLWNNAFGVLSKGDHYILLFWRQNALSSTPPVSMPAVKSPRMWTYILALAAASLYLLTLLFGKGMRRGEQVPIDKYIPSLSPLVQHALQFLFLLTFLLAVFPRFYSKLANLLRGFWQSASLARRQK